MRTRFIILAVIAQVLLLAYMAGEREWILRSGRTVLLRTAPIDPNDPMRGEYARFNYEISSVPSSLWRDELLRKLTTNGYDYRAVRDLQVYAALRLDDSGVAELVSLSDRPPTGGLYLQGRVNSVNGQRVSVRYGIEALFMQQGKSQKLENARRTERPGAPMDAEIAVSSSGLAVLKDYHWEPLGLTVTFERSPVAPPQPNSAARDNSRRQQFITGLNVVLKNYGPEDVAIVDLPEAGAFRLVSDTRWQEARYRWVGESQPPNASKLEATNIIVLKAGQSHSTKIDLTQPRWFVIDTKAKPEQQKPLALRDITDTWSASFRLEYAPPPRESTTTLPNASLVRYGTLRSQAFNPLQGRD